MLNTIFYISDNFNDFSNISLEKDQSGINLSFLIPSSDQKKLEETYQFFSNNTLNQFSLTIILDISFDNNLLHYLVSFFFLPNYLKINNQIVINFICEKKDFFIKAQNDLIEKSAKQGITNLKISRLSLDISNTSTEATQNPNYLHSNIDNLILHYTNTIHSQAFYNNTFYVNNDAAELRKLNSIIISANDFIKINNPSLYDVALKLQILLQENLNLKSKNTSLINELDNYKTHVNVLKSVHEATELQLYYNKEYEVLPVWYKRFGHILKFIMGKRNFKSLFYNK